MTFKIIMLSKLEKYELNAREQKYAYLDLRLPYFVFELKDKVKPDLLYKAVLKSVHFHPLFATSLIFDKIYYFVEDPKWEQHYDGILIGGGNGRKLWEISYKENKVFFTGSHALCDGMGVMQFCATLFHLYFELCGHCFSDTADCDFPKLIEPLSFDFEKDCPIISKAYAGTPKFPNPVELSADYFSLNIKQSLHMLEIRKEEIRRFASISETSVFSIIACLLARTLEKTFEINDGSIHVRIPADFRKNLGVATDHNFSHGFSLCYRCDKMSHLNDELVETAFRSQMDIFADKENMIYSLRKDFGRLKTLKEGKTDLGNFKQGIEIPRAIISYSHLTHPGFSKELEKLIKRIYMVSDSVDPYVINVGAISFNEMVIITMNQHIVDNRFIDSLVDTLDKKGMKYKLTEINLNKIGI